MTSKTIKMIKKDSNLDFLETPLQWNEVFEIIWFYKKNKNNIKISIYKEIKLWIIIYIWYFITNHLFFISFITSSTSTSTFISSSTSSSWSTSISSFVSSFISSFISSSWSIFKSSFSSSISRFFFWLAQQVVF